MSGFTLIEMAIVLFIFGLLIAGVLGPLETQLEARDRNQTIRTMNEAIEALYGYAISNGRLPCPDTNGDGMPDMTNQPYDPLDDSTGDCVGGTFDDGEGFLPWVELNVPPGDAWGNRFRYKVRWPNFTWPDSDTPAFFSDRVCDGNTAPEEFDLCATGNILVQTRGDNPSTPGMQGKFLTALANNVPVILLSHGRNGFGATSIGGIARPTAITGTDEEQNTNGGNTFLSRGYSSGGAGCDESDETAGVPLCAFDDIVMWLSPTILNNRMVTSGRLP